MLVASTVWAQPKKQSRSVIAADGWLKAMTDPSAIEPMSYGKDKPLTFKVQSADVAACKKLRSGKATKGTEVRALKTCFVATWKYVSQDAQLELEDMREKDLDGDQTKWAKTAPKGTTWVAGRWQYAEQDLTINLALGPDFTVLAVWFVYLENDGE
jgi:hypothetical protein